MAQIGQVQILRTDPATDFTGALAQNVMATLNKSVANVGGGLTVRYRLKGLIIASMENLAWEVWLFANNLFATGNPATAKPLGYWSFAAADAKRPAAASGLYYYYIDGLDIPVVDDDSLTQLHIGLMNRSAASKTAGAAGALSIGFVLEETNGL